MDDFRKDEEEKEDLQSAVIGVIGFRRWNPTTAGSKVRGGEGETPNAESGGARQVGSYSPKFTA
jgi:hypothetical protein